MKKKVLSVLLALVLGLSLVTAVPVAAQGGVVTNIDTQETFDTIQAAIDDDDTIAGHTIEVGAGEWDGAVVTKPVEVRGEDGAVIVGGSSVGPGECGFRIASDGVTISHFTFEVEFPVYSRPLAFDDVTVEHNVMGDPIQGVTNWNGSRWTIRHNVITGLWDLGGGGIGIFIGASVGLPAKDNLVAFNKIIGDFPEDRNYTCTGICLITYGPEVTGNKVVHNDVLITGSGTHAIGMTFSKWYTAGIDPEDVLKGNKIGFNDLRGSSVGIGCTIWDEGKGDYLSAEDARALMEGCNLISRNLGENRAYDGIPAKEFRAVTED